MSALRGRGAALAALVAFAAGLLFAFAVVRVHDPDVIFPKYIAAAAAPPAERAERILDYSPLYLALVRAVEAPMPPGDFRAVLIVQGGLHAVAAAAVALAVGMLAGVGWGLAAGLGVAAYRPLLVYAGVHEPETLIAACLALAMLGGIVARRRIAAGTRILPALTLAFVPLALAGLGRPQHLALLPLWAWWISSGSPELVRGWARRRVWTAAGLAAAAIVGPVVAARSLAAGAPALMNPGPVFYEGNAPGAMGLVRYAPAAVIELERAHAEAFDYGHVAYRRIASAAPGRQLSAGESNRWWASLAGEGLASWPGIAARRFARKAALALAPYEGHDLAVAEGIDRRLRPLLPWGFALLLVAVPWIFFARRERLGELAGPLAVAGLAFVLQVLVYASARQRLPMAVGLWVAAPVLAAELARGRLRALRPAVAVLLGIAVALGAGAAGGRIAVLDRLGWDRLLGAAPESLGEKLLALQEGRAQRPAVREAALRFAAGVDLSRAGRPADSLRVLAPLVGSGEDFTVDDKTVGVPEHWAARDLAMLGRQKEAREMAARALEVRPQDPEVQALARWLRERAQARAATSGEEKSAGDGSGTSGIEAVAAEFRPPGTDPVSARILLARAAQAEGDEATMIQIVRPLVESFPELAPRARR